MQVTNFTSVTSVTSDEDSTTVECTAEGIPPLKITIGEKMLTQNVNTITENSSRVTLRQEVQPGQKVFCLVENMGFEVSTFETVVVHQPGRGKETFGSTPLSRRKTKRSRRRKKKKVVVSN